MTNTTTRNVILVIGAIVTLSDSSHAQLWDRLTKPRVQITLSHPPRLGLNLKKIAFGSSSGQCADEIMDGLQSTLLSSQVEVIDRQHLDSILKENHFQSSGYMDSASATQMGKMLGPSALVFVKVNRCYDEKKLTHKDERVKDGIVRTYYSTVTVHIRGSVNVVDLTTGRVFSASPIEETKQAVNYSQSGVPEAPSVEQVRDQAIKAASGYAASFLVPWQESKQVYFFNDKDCELNLAYAALRAGNIPGTVEKSEKNLENCKSATKTKGSSLAHAYYNAGLANLLINQHAKAMSYLEESEKLKGGDIVSETIAEAQKSANLAIAMLQVVAKTERFEQSRAVSAATEKQVAAPIRNEKPKESIEDRLKKVDSLFQKGIINKQEYEQKKADLLKEL